MILHVTAKEGPPERADYFQIGEEGDLTPGIMSVWSAPFELNGREAERMVCRRFGLGKMKGEEGKVLKIWEGLGESIAGHVWYVPPVYYLVNDRFPLSIP